MQRGQEHTQLSQISHPYDWQRLWEQTTKAVSIKSSFVSVLLQHYWSLKEAAGNKHYILLNSSCACQQGKSSLCTGTPSGIKASHIPPPLTYPALKILGVAFADWWTWRAGTRAQDFIAEDIFICSQITRETLCQTTSSCRQPLWQYWQLCSGSSNSFYLSTLGNACSSTAVHADVQLKTQVHISWQQGVKNQRPQTLKLFSISLYRHRINSMHFWHLHSKPFYSHSNSPSPGEW